MPWARQKMKVEKLMIEATREVARFERHFRSKITSRGEKFGVPKRVRLRASGFSDLMNGR